MNQVWSRIRLCGSLLAVAALSAGCLDVEVEGDLHVKDSAFSLTDRDGITAPIGSGPFHLYAVWDENKNEGEMSFSINRREIKYRLDAESVILFEPLQVTLEIPARLSGQATDFVFDYRAVERGHKEFHYYRPCTYPCASTPHDPHPTMCQGSELIHQTDTAYEVTSGGAFLKDSAIAADFAVGPKLEIRSHSEPVGICH